MITCQIMTFSLLKLSEEMTENTFWKLSTRRSKILISTFRHLLFPHQEVNRVKIT